MITTSKYSFVRLNEDGDSLCNSPQACLPLNNLTDLKFNIIADFKFDENLIGILGTVCETCGDFADTIVSSSGVAGKLQIVVHNETLYAKTAVGNAVHLQGRTQQPLDVTGNYNVLARSKAGGFSFITLDLAHTFDLDLGNSPIVFPIILDTYYQEQLEDNAEVPGENFLWRVSKSISFHQNLPNISGCYRFCLVKVYPTYDVPDECLGVTNCFSNSSDICNTTKIRYSNNENSFGFYAEETVRLPMYLSRPQYPGTEKGYQYGTGQFVKLAERINKTWLLKVNWVPEGWHERLRVALSCDNVHVTNGDTDEDIYKSDDYKVGWDEAEFDLARIYAPGSVTVYKQLLSKSVNSNCS